MLYPATRIAGAHDDEGGGMSNQFGWNNSNFWRYLANGALQRSWSCINPFMKNLCGEFSR